MGWDPGEQGIDDYRALRRRGAAESLDPNLEDTYTRELAGWFERELFDELRRPHRLRVARSTAAVPARRTSFQSVRELHACRSRFPIPDLTTSAGMLTMARRFRGSTWPAGVHLPDGNVQKNVPNSDSDFYTWEVTGTKRFSNRWSLLASYAHTWVKEFENAYFGNTVRQNNLRVTPNDLINTDRWPARVHDVAGQAARHVGHAVVEHQDDAHPAAPVGPAAWPDVPVRLRHLRHAARPGRAARHDAARTTSRCSISASRK